MLLIWESEMYYSPTDLDFCFYIEKSDFYFSAGMKIFMRNSHWEKPFRVLLIFCCFCFDCVFGKENLKRLKGREEKILVQDIIIGVGTNRMYKAQCRLVGKQNA